MVSLGLVGLLDIPSRLWLATRCSRDPKLIKRPAVCGHGFSKPGGQSEKPTEKKRFAWPTAYTLYGVVRFCAQNVVVEWLRWT